MYFLFCNSKFKNYLRVISTSLNKNYNQLLFLKYSESMKITHTTTVGTFFIIPMIAV